MRSAFFSRWRKWKAKDFQRAHNPSGMAGASASEKNPAARRAELMQGCAAHTFDGAAACSVLIWHIHTRLSWLGNAMMHPPAPHSERAGTVPQPRGVSRACVEPHARIARAATSSRLIRTNSFAWIVFGALDPCARAEAGCMLRSSRVTCSAPNRVGVGQAHLYI